MPQTKYSLTHLFEISKIKSSSTLTAFSYFSLPFLTTSIISLNSFLSFSISLFYSFKIRLIYSFSISNLCTNTPPSFNYYHCIFIIFTVSIISPFSLTGTLTSLLTCNWPSNFFFFHKKIYACLLYIITILTSPKHPQIYTPSHFCIILHASFSEYQFWSLDF